MDKKRGLKSANREGNKSHRSARSAKSARSKSRSRTPGRRAKSSNKFAKKIHADDTMSMTQLQKLAKSVGLPFGGLSKTILIKKINKYA